MADVNDWKETESSENFRIQVCSPGDIIHPDVPEEHRSNVLGQVIAKGERISIDAAIEFIDQKHAEMILTDEISDKLNKRLRASPQR